MKNFWEVIYDDSNSTMEIIGLSANDTLLTKNVVEMQRVGMKIRCQAIDASIPIQEIKVSGYTIKENLYSNLLIQYEEQTEKMLKRW